jgi:hypothetical protein
MTLPDGLPLARLPMLGEHLETGNGTRGQEHDDGQGYRWQ